MCPSFSWLKDSGILDRFITHVTHCISNPAGGSVNRCLRCCRRFGQKPQEPVARAGPQQGDRPPGSGSGGRHCHVGPFHFTLETPGSAGRGVVWREMSLLRGDGVAVITELRCRTESGVCKWVNDLFPGFPRRVHVTPCDLVTPLRSVPGQPRPGCQEHSGDWWLLPGNRDRKLLCSWEKLKCNVWC